jgi:hypothetical protein
MSNFIKIRPVLLPVGGRMDGQTDTHKHTDT